MVAAKAMERIVYTELHRRVLSTHARLGIQEEEKLLILKYVNSLSLYIQQDMEFMTISMLADAFQYNFNLEAKQKGKARFANKPIG